MKKVLSLILAAVMICALFAGCATSGQPGNESSNQPAGDSSKGSETKEATITMWTFLDPTNTTNGRSIALAKMIEKFEKENPGVKIQVEPQDYLTMTAKFMAATTTNSAPDIIWCGRDELPGVLDANVLEPLENLFLGEWTSEEIADISDAYFDYGERDGKHYILALSKNAPLLYYRADLFEKNNLSVPTTWDELVEAAKILTGKDEETGISRYGLGQSFSTESTDSQAMSNMILAKQSLFDANGAANWTNDVAVDALDWTIKCIKEWGITPEEAVNTTNEDLFLEFQAGKYAMFIGGGVRCASVKASASFDGNYVQLAKMPGGAPAVLDGWFVGVWAGSQNKELAGKFLETMYSPESDTLWVADGGQTPVRKSTLDSMNEFIDTDENRFLAVMVDAFADGWFPDNSNAYIGWKFDINQAAQNVLVENMTAPDALAATASDFNSRNKR